jgi:CRISPR system Cascade subunit CasD
MLAPKKSDGKKPSGDVTGVTITTRYYLQDAAFAVSLEVPGDLSESISTALQHPVWDVYLGRRCCTPTDMIYRGQFSSEYEALDRAAAIAEEKHRVEDFRVIDGIAEDEDGESFTINDVPVQFGEEKTYMDRKVSLIHVQ